MNLTVNLPPDDNSLTITIRGAGQRGMQGIASGGLESAMFEGNALESKADVELEMDFTACTGFNTSFMGFKTPLPVPGPKLKRKIAHHVFDPQAYVLDYYHYSTIHHALRRMPVVSAVNIDGNPKLRKDENKRNDVWLRDNRIDFDVQLNDAFYKKSSFDKGHMVRREDANWGRTGNEAFRNAQLTCMYTNACPQVPALNRAIFGSEGLWGQLEQLILEQGVEAEQGREGRICVYNGPVFVDSDPVFKGVQIPLRFYKIVVWLNGAGKKRTTAFILSQEDLVADIKFEELRLDEEFKEHQCSVTFLEQLTGLSFGEIAEWDTFKKQAGKLEVAAVDEQTLKAIIKE